MRACNRICDSLFVVIKYLTVPVPVWRAVNKSTIMVECESINIKKWTNWQLRRPVSVPSQKVSGPLYKLHTHVTESIEASVLFI